MIDDERFANAITALAETYRVKASVGLYQGYSFGLVGIPINDIERACGLALQRLKFMPTPAELRELAMTGGPSYESLADRAFAVLLSAVRRHGSDRSVNFEDGAINAVVRRLGGWKSCCDQPRSQLEVWYRKSFTASYVSVLREGASEDERRYLSGTMESQYDAQEGLELSGGRVFRAIEFGGGVHSVGGPYRPSLPSPAPQPRRAISNGAEAVGLQLQFVEPTQRSRRLALGDAGDQ